MALFRKFFYRKPPDGLLEISERVYVFDCCFTTDICEDEEYKVYIGNTVAQLRDHFPDASFMVFNFREGETQSRIASILSEYDMTVMDYPRHYEGCPLLTMEMIHHFLRSSESWLSLGQQNVLLMHCERGGWPVLAFMLAALLIYRKQYTGEQKTLDMIYKQAPRELLQLMAPLNPLPSQLRYLQYVSRRNVGSEWPPLDRALTLDCVILRVIPNLDYEGGCRPIFRIYGQDPLMVADSTPKVLFSTPKSSNLVRHYKQADCDLVKIDIHCHIQGDVVMECISLDSNLEREQMVFRVMFNTAFIRSNILMLNRDEVDRLWNFKEFPKDFRAEVLFSEMDTGSNHASVDLPCLDEKDGLPVEAFAKVQEMFSTVDWLDSKTDVALNVLQQITAIQENLETNSPRIAEIGSVLLESTLEKIQENPKKGSEKKARGFESIILDGQSLSSPRLSPVANEVKKTDETEEGKFTIQSMSIAKQSPNSSLAGPQEQTLSLQTSNKLSSGGDSVRKKSEPENLHISVQRPAQSKIISPRVPQALASPPVPSQGSPMAISKYQTSPSPLGITALLHDHAASKGEEVARPVTVTLLSSTVSSPAKDTPKSVEVSHEFNKDLPQAPTMPLLHSSIQAVCSIESSATLHSSSPQTSKTTHSSFHQASEPSLNRTEVPIVSPLLPNSSSTTLFPPFPPSPPPPPPPLSLKNALGPTVRSLNSTPPPPTLKGFSSLVPSAGSSLQPENKSATLSGPLPPPPPSLLSKSVQVPVSAPTPPPPPLPSFSCVSRGASPSPNAPPPPPPAPFGKATSKGNGVSPQTNSAVSNGNVPPVPGPPSTAHFSAIGRGFVRTNPKHQVQSRKANLKPYHWLKLTRAMQGSLWAEAQKSDEATKAPEFDLSELESLFSAAAPNSEPGSTRGKTNRRISGAKSDTVQLVELRRAYNCEIMLSKVKIPLPDLMSSVLALDDSALDVDQVDNLIKFCPTKEEMEMLKGYSGDKEKLGKCEQFFLELMKVPRVESKLRVFSFKIQFNPQVSDLRRNLHVVNSVAEEIRTSMKLKQVMQTILSLGNALNHGTARGSAIGFRLDSLLKLTDTRGRNNKMTLMHYLCKVLAEKLPDLLDFPRDLMSLEAATKIQLKYLAEEMQAISKGLEKVVQELSASENDGLVSQKFCKTLKAFLSSAESEVRSLASLYSNVGRNADALAHYFGEDPARCPFEQVVSTLLNFARMFVRAHEENCKQLELEKKKEQKEAENENLKRSASRKEIEKLIQSPRRSGNVK